MSTALRISLLGPIQATRDGTALRLGGTKPRLVLALLALHPGRVVSVDGLTDALWEDEPPATASASLQVHVSALRRVLDEPDQPSCVVNRAPGYVLDVEPRAVDVVEFEQLADEGRALVADGRFAEAAEVLRRADGLWRGAALADLAGEHAIIGPATALEEARLAAAECRIGADLGRGAHAEVVAELRSLLVVHPLREDLWAALMLALYRGGRQSDALAAYQQARTTLVDELGIDPGPALQALEQEVLAQSPALDWSQRPADALPPLLATTIIGDGVPAPDAVLITPDGAAIALDGRCTIGRHPDSTVVLDDALASRHHAQVRPVRGAHVLTDLDSTNGTLLDGARITEEILEDGAEIAIGTTVLRYERVQ